MLRLHDSDHADAPRHDGAPALVASAPLLELLYRTAEAVELLEGLTPDNPAISACRRQYRKLWAAINEAAERPVWVSTEEAARRLDLSRSHVQHLCNRDPNERPFRARKFGNVWRIDAWSLSALEEAA